jgi:quercetin 2,3-dioxygenase
MSTPRTVIAEVPATSQLEGGGFVVHRPFPTPRLPMVDPFLLLDHMGPADYAPGEAVGAPDHPHRGFETVTYMLEGAFEHEDSAGHRGRIGPGDVQWMTAGAGVIHSEMPSADIQRDGGRVQGFQIWVNLPAADKMVAPRYQEYTASQIPVVEQDGGVKIRVIAGDVDGVRGAVDTHTAMTYLHVTLPPSSAATFTVPESQNAMVYGVSGPGADTLTVFDHDGDSLTVTNPADEERDVLVLAGEPLGEPVARYGPFVMSTPEEIEQAITDFQSGSFGEIART